MTHTYCMTSNCALAETCARYEDDAGKHLLTRSYADFSEELIRRQDGTAICPFFMPRDDAQQAVSQEETKRRSLRVHFGLLEGFRQSYINRINTGRQS